MMTYCKHCRRNHAAWIRLNDGLICGRCGSYERNQQIVPLNAYAGQQQRALKLYADNPKKAG